MNIKSTSDLLGISADTIRYYERLVLCHRLLELQLEFVIFKTAILKLWNLLSVFVRRKSL